MNNGVFVGIDYGELGLHVAYAAPQSSPSFLRMDLDFAEPTILYDAGRNISSLGIGFPSVLQSVGSGLPFINGGRSETPELHVQRRLAVVSERIKQHAGESPGPTVIAVPGSLSQRKRQTLVNCAKKAGFPDASLIDRPIAVALGVRTDRDQSGTFVVFIVDYGPCEYSLARLARGRCWIVGSALEPRVSGERLDALIMEDIILGLRDRQVFLGLRRFGPEQWLKFRHVAESVRQKLANDKTVQITLSPDLTDTPSVMSVRLDPARFALAVKRQLGDALENVSAMLEQNQLESSNVDAVLLVGDVAADHPVANIVWESYPDKVARTDENVIALGAVIHAADSAGAALPASNRSGFTTWPGLHGLAPARVETGGGGNGSGQFTEIIAVEGLTHKEPATAADQPPRQTVPGDRLSEVRALTKAARYREAEQLLASLVKEIEALKEDLQASVPTRSQQLIQQAQALMVDGRYTEAVQLAHEAYQAAPNDAAVFSGMMKVHADAGVGLNRPDEYESAIRILSCAYGHDQTDRTIHKALAERHYQHARAMLRLNNPERALEAAKNALAFDPKHVEANELLGELLRREETGPEAER